MIYRAAMATGNAAKEPIAGLISPIRAAINPTGNAIDTAPRVSKLVRGAIRETYPKCIAVSGRVKTRAPVVVAKLDEVKFITALNTFFL